MPEYIYILHPLRQGFFTHPTPEEEAAMQAHFQYLQHASERGELILAGPCQDETFGLVIFRAEDEAAARKFMFNDPSIMQNVMVAELHPFRTSLAGK